MSITLELPEKLITQLKEYCRKQSRTEREVIQYALGDFLNREQPAPTAYELWRQVFTPKGSQQPDLGSCAKEHLKERLHGRHFG